MFKNIFNKKELRQEPKKYIHALEREDLLSAEEFANLKSNVLHAISDTVPEDVTARYRYEEAVVSRSFWNWHLVKSWQYALAIFVGISLVGGTVFASNASIPGDFLYPVKIATETVVLKLAVTPVAKTQLKAQFAEDRIAELQKLSAKSVVASSQSSTDSNQKSSTANQAQILLQAKAKIDAANQVNQALTALQQQQKTLTAKGDIKTATDFSNRISNLQKQAKSLNVLPSSVSPISVPAEMPHANVNNGKNDSTDNQTNQKNKSSGSGNQTDIGRKTQRTH